MSKGFSLLPLSLLSLLSFLLLSRADPVSLPFRDCYDTSKGVDNKFSIDNVYAQVLENEEFGTFLNLTVFGSSPTEIVGYTNTSGSLATLFTTTSILTLNAFTNSIYLCEHMRPQSPLPALEGNRTDYCPIAAGPFAFSQSIPWGNNRELTTLHTRLRAVDPFGEEVFCLDVETTPLDPTAGSIYGRAYIILWATVGLTVAYWVMVGLARVQSAWNRGLSRSGKGLWGRAQSAGFILASAVSGERLANSPALLRFCTPSMRDIIFHTQWCALLGMVAVEWPQFAYPLLTQTAWSTLTYNVSLTRGARENHWDPLSTPAFEAPATFADQVADPQNPLYIVPNQPNVIYHLPSDASHGISSFAYTLGVRPQDLFSTCLILFLGIIAATIVISGVFWFIDVFVTSILEKFAGNAPAYGHTGRGVKSPAFGNTTSKEVDGSPVGLLEEDTSISHAKGLGLVVPGSSPGNGRLTASPSGDRERGFGRSSWWCFPRLRSDIGSFHGNVLHGNLVRILILFHLPVTVFSCYQMTLPKSVASQSSIALAALSFVFISVLIPAHLVIRVTFTSTNKLYDDMRTLLSLGPLYNHYRHGSQLFASLFFATNLAFGVTIGAGQKSGTAQAIVILVVEVISALVTSIWLPWGAGASMGLISFLFCVARIVIAVLLVILTPTISIGTAPGGWVAYGIMVVLALVYLALVLLLLVKFIEALVRIFGQVGFDRSRHVVDSGLVGACGMLGCCGSRRRNKRRGKGKNNGRPGKYKGSEIGTSPSSQNLGSTLLRDRRPSDLSSYNPPAALLRGDGGSESGSLMGPRFLGGADSRKGSTHSQPPSVLRPEHANQPYREETDMSWWNENEQQGGAFIMGAWQPFAGQPGNAQGNYVPVPNPQSPPQPSKPSPQAATPSTGFSRVGGGRAHIDSPYSIHPTGNSHSQSGFQNPSSSSQAFPSVAPHTSQFINASLPPSAHATPSPTPVQSVPHSHQPSLSGSNAYPPSSFSRHYQPPPSQTYLDDEEPLPLSTVRQAHPGPMQMVVQPPHPHNDFNQLPPGAMQPAHVRTKSQTAIIEDAGSFLYGPNSNNVGTSASQSGISARFSLGNPNHPPLQPITIPNQTGGLTPPNYQTHPTSAPPLSKFTLAADDDDNDDDESVAEDQQQKKKWYQLRKKRPHSSEGRTTTTATPTAPSGISGSSSSMPLPQDQEGNAGEGSAGIDGGTTPQRSFVVIRKPMGSTGRLNQVGSGGAASGSGQGSRSRPPTR